MDDDKYTKHEEYKKKKEELRPIIRDIMEDEFPFLLWHEDSPSFF